MPESKKASKGDYEIKDTRFSDFATDPRFRLPSKKHTRTKIDKRFSRMLTDDDFTSTAKVDRYGRKLSTGGKKKVLENLYVPDEEEQAEHDDGGLGGKKSSNATEPTPGTDASSDEDEQLNIEVEDDDIVEKELKKAAAYDPARGGGFSSSSEEDSDSDEEEAEIEEVEFPDMQGDQAEVEMGEVSSRIAVVNMDWDNIRAIDLMAVFQSFVKPGGKIHKISIYQSEFGKQRMEREELEGPPKEIFAKKREEEDDSDDSEDESEEESDEEKDEKIKKELLKEDDGQDFDGAALRHYQLERLRYYYAVVVCSDNEIAQNIYEATDGTEYLSSANFFDLRFIPDGTDFDDTPRDECAAIPADYRPTEFVTDALQHSKVKLTWDMNPEEASRKDAIKRAFSGSRTEIGENDLRAYLGSDSEEDEEEEQMEAEEETPQLSKKDLARQKMRAALGLSDEPTKSSKKVTGPVGDMEVTFTAGLSANEKGGVFENKPIIEETTAERYIRKSKERKARRKEKAKAIREGRDPDAEPEGSEKEAGKNADLGFDDPFFTSDKAVKDKASKSLRKEARLEKREAKQAEAAEKASQRAGLELLMQDDSLEAAEHLDHFDINEIARAEQQKKKRQRGKKGKELPEGGKRGGLQENFKMDVQDPRFSKVHESHDFAIDPSHPRYKATEAMQKLLDEGRKRKGIEADEETSTKRDKKRKTAAEEDSGLSSLVEKVKNKTKR